MGQSDLELFLKCDRFSRNAGDACQMIYILSKLGIESQALEPPLDFNQKPITLSLFSG